MTMKINDTVFHSHMTNKENTFVNAFIDAIDHTNRSFHNMFSHIQLPITLLDTVTAKHLLAIWATIS